jgi:NDP-sugar pyrophosphorylase family protein
MKPTLVVLAAGLGSRYGSLKQMDRFGPSGETIVDYAIYDAIEVGFGKIIFVIREHFEQEFREIFGPKMDGKVQAEFVFQKLDNLPNGFEVPEGREKPWGTAHAVMTAASKINEPFAIVNADDFYGRSSFQKVYNHLSTLDNDKLSACLIGFMLENTLSDHGRVSRGICELDQQNHLQKIVERTHIFKKETGGAYYEEDGHKVGLSGKEIVSMNLMGFTSKVFDKMEKSFIEFLTHKSKDLKSEFFVPIVLDEIRKSGVKVPVFTSSEQWFGVTYKEDKQIAQQKILELVAQKVYPKNLWQLESI